MKEIIISKKARGEDGHRVITLRIRQDLLEQIELIANKTDRSRNEVVVFLLSAALENVTIEE